MMGTCRPSGPPVHRGASPLRALGRGPVDALQIDHEGLLVLRCHVLQRVANLLDDTKLNLGVRVNSGDGLGESSQPIHAGNQGVVDTPGQPPLF